MALYDVFISYSRKDFDEVNAFVKMLQKRIPQLSYWFDIKGIESGDEFTEKIISAIDNSSYMLFALSDNSIASEWTKDEVMYAKNIGKKVIPVLLKGASLKGWFLFKFGRIDYIDSVNELQVDKLIGNLCDWTGKAVASSVPDKTAPTPAPTPAPAAKTYKVGDYYNENDKEGVVFEVDATGRHGKIVGMKQVERQWCPYEEYEKNISTCATDKNDGMKNMQTIMCIPDWRSKYPAFAWCAEQGEGWYLPAIEELKKFTLDDSIHDAVNRTLSQKNSELLIEGEWLWWYWSSSEDTVLLACGVTIDEHHLSGSVKKNVVGFVRAVSAF